MAGALAGCTPASQSGGPQPAGAVAAAASFSLPAAQARIDADYIAPFKAGDVERWLMIFTDDVVGLHNRMPALDGKSGLRGFGSFVAQNLTVPEMSVDLTGAARARCCSCGSGRLMARGRSQLIWATICPRPAVHDCALDPDHRSVQRYRRSNRRAFSGARLARAWNGAPLGGCRPSE